MHGSKRCGSSSSLSFPAQRLPWVLKERVSRSVRAHLHLTHSLCTARPNLLMPARPQASLPPELPPFSALAD